MQAFLYRYLKMKGRVVIWYCYLGLFTVHCYSCMQYLSRSNNCFCIFMTLFHMEKFSSVLFSMHSESNVWFLSKSTENIIETSSIMKVRSVL